MLTSTYSTSWTREDSVASPSSHAITIESLSGFLEVFAATRESDDGGSLALALNQALHERDVHGIDLLPPREETPVPDVETQAPDRRERTVSAYQQALDFIRESMVNIDSPAQVNIRKAKRTVQKLVDLSYEEGEGFSLAGMASIKAHDDYTFNHMVNVCVLAIAFGQRLGLETPGAGPAGPERALPRHGQATYSSGGAEQTNRTHGRGVGPDG